MANMPAFQASDASSILAARTKTELERVIRVVLRLFMEKLYRVVINRQEQVTETPGEYAGWRAGKIFGRLACRSGMRMKPESRIFFANMEEAIASGYRPCNKCKPMNQDDFDRHSAIIAEMTLQKFYGRNKK